MTTVAVSGGFDPIHPGHIRMLEHAHKQYGNVVVILNSDEWLIRKKGFCFLPWDDRAEIIRAFNCVAKVVAVDDRDDTVCKALKVLNPDYFANGGDRGSNNTPEINLCLQENIKPVFNIGGGKIESSSAIATKGLVHRDWGTYQILIEGHGFQVKVLKLNPSAKTSVQRHLSRDEIWTVLDGFSVAYRGFWESILHKGDSIEIPRGTKHQLVNSGNSVLTVLEVQFGEISESDIERF